MGSHDDETSRNRSRIDQLDQEIIGLIQRRLAISRDIQNARVRLGEPRIQHAREISIILRYRDRLGERGGSLALLLLEMARGPRQREEQPSL